MTTQVVATKAEFLKLFSCVQDVVDRKHINPILTNFMFAVRNDKMRVAATDSFLSIRSMVKIAIPGDEFGILLPAKETLDRFKNMPDGEIRMTLQSDGSTVLIESLVARRKFKISCCPATEFPELPAYDRESAEKFSIPTKRIAELVDKTIFSCSQDVSRPHMNGALFELENHIKFRMVTTDGHRLTKCEVVVPQQTELPSAGRRRRIKNFSLLLPFKGVQTLSKLCDIADGDIDFVHEGNNVFFEYTKDGNKFMLSVRLAEAQFVAWQNIMPTTSKYTLVVPVANFMTALRALLVDVSDVSGMVKITFTKRSLVIRTDTDRATDEIELEDGPDKPITIGFNIRYLLDVLSAVGKSEKSIHMIFTDENNPVLLEWSDKTTTFIGLVMPMRINLQE